MNLVEQECAAAVTTAEEEVKRCKQNLQWAETALVKAKRQAACKHENVDGSVFGDTCRDCGYYLNNGG